MPCLLGRSDAYFGKTHEIVGTAIFEFHCTENLDIAVLKNLSCFQMRLFCKLRKIPHFS